MFQDKEFPLIFYREKTEQEQKGRGDMGCNRYCPLLLLALGELGHAGILHQHPDVSCSLTPHRTDPALPAPPGPATLHQQCKPVIWHLKSSEISS